MRQRSINSNEPVASPSLKVRVTQAPEPRSALSASPMDTWVMGLRSAFEPDGGKKPAIVRLRST